MSTSNLRSRKPATSAGAKTDATNTRPDPRHAVSTSTSTSTPTHSLTTSRTTTMANPDDPRIPLLGAKKLVSAHPTTSLSGQHVSPSSSASTLLSPELKDAAAADVIVSEAEMENLSKKSQWIVLALASGACAAFNGVFAKLTTTELTTNFATAIANLIGLSNVEGVVEVVVRGIFFSLNLIFNGIMWTLFTKALARGTSTTQVSIINTSSNFMITAVLGFLIFSEKLPPMWFVGAAMLVAGNVIIGRRDEGEKEGDRDGGLGRVERGNGEGEGLLEGEEVELEGELRRGKGKGGEGDEDMLDLGVESEEEDGITRDGSFIRIDR